MGIALVAGAIGVDAAEAERLIEELGRDVREALDETRRLAERIYPPLLDTGGLGVALRTAAAGADVPVQIDVVASAPYPPAIAGAVYFCCLDVLEAVSAGTPVAISVNDEAGRLTFDIAADGHVDIEELPLRDRIEALGGRLTIEGSGDETRAVGSLPLSGGG